MYGHDPLEAAELPFWRGLFSPNAQILKILVPNTAPKARILPSVRLKTPSKAAELPFVMSCIFI